MHSPGSKTAEWQSKRNRASLGTWGQWGGGGKKNGMVPERKGTSVPGVEDTSFFFSCLWRGSIVYAYVYVYVYSSFLFRRRDTMKISGVNAAFHYIPSVPFH